MPSSRVCFRVSIWPFPDAAFRYLECFGQLLYIPRLFSGREFVELFDHARLHLVGGLVGKGDGQNMPVLVFGREEQAQVLPRQPVGFSRSGGSFYQ